MFDLRKCTQYFQLLDKPVADQLFKVILYYIQAYYIILIDSNTMVVKLRASHLKGGLPVGPQHFLSQ